jgi:hypothetical protein
MSTEITTIKGTCHIDDNEDDFKVADGEAFISLTRFYNGKEKGTNIQLTVTQNGMFPCSYIHLTKDQCKELAQILLDCFNYTSE